MLIRISGGHSGIRAYLETGKKQGRTETREEIDERVPLRGDIDLLEACIDSIPGGAEKYLHVTLSFKEDYLDPSLYRQIVECFERFAFAAYHEDEYMLYAEAHLPRRKSFIDRATGRVIERKPHVHVVIPKRNLLSGRSLNPFGMLYQTSRYVDAFQEELNADLGLASPKRNRRTRIEGKADIIARHSGTLPAGSGKQLKESILSVIIRRSIGSLDELESALTFYGVVRRRNAGKESVYLNVKPPDAAKGVNLKEYVFSDAFLRLPPGEKRKLLSDADPGYIDRAFGIEPSPEYVSLLGEWRDLASLEIKYLNSGSHKEYKQYIEMDAESKKEFLKRKADRFHARYDRRNREVRPVEVVPNLEALSAKFDMKIAEIELPDEVNLGTNPIAHAIRNRAEEDLKNRDVDRIKEAKNRLDPESLLEYAAREHGLVASKYKASKSAEGFGRILCGKRNLNLADFLTKEMHLPWTQASGILAQLYAEQVHSRPPESLHAQEKDTFSKLQDHALRVGEREESVRSRSASVSISELRNTFRADRAEIYHDRCTARSERNVRLSILQTGYLAGIERIIEDTSHDRLISSNGTASAQHHPSTSFAGITCLAPAWPRFKPLFRKLEHTFRIRGSVDYLKDGKVIMRDTGNRVIAMQNTEEALEACLRLAIIKYGPKVQVFGSEKFQRRIVQVAAEKRMRLTFAEPALEKLRKEYRGKPGIDWDAGR